MREILFRAKDFKDEWIYGSLMTRTILAPNWDDLKKPQNIIVYSILCKPEFDWTQEYKEITEE